MEHPDVDLQRAADAVVKARSKMTARKLTLDIRKGQIDDARNLFTEAETAWMDARDALDRILMARAES